MDNENEIAAGSLRRIDGIGPAYAKALEAIGIRRISDLARFETPAELHQALQKQKEREVPLWRIESEDWLGQASRLSHETAPEEQSSEAELEASPNENWQQHAHFLVFFDYLEGEGSWQTRVWQTRTYHDESDEEKMFEGVNPEPWVSWIMEKASLPVPAWDEMVFEAQEAPDEREPSADELVFVTPQASDDPVEIMAVDLYESQPGYGVLQGKLTADVQFRVSRESHAAAQAAFRLEVYLYETTSHTSTLVASAEGQLEPGKDQYRIQAELPFAAEGRYRVHCVLFLLPPVSQLAVHNEHIVKFVSH